jgi:hypothetical protein
MTVLVAAAGSRAVRSAAAGLVAGHSSLFNFGLCI